MIAASNIGWKSATPDRRVASFRYRAEGPVAALAARGHEVGLFNPARQDSYDTVVFSKTYSAADRSLARKLRATAKRVVFDLCDNHFYNPHNLPRYQRARSEILEMMALADRVIVTTAALAAVVRDETGGSVQPIVVGDMVERIQPARRPRDSGASLRLLWFGSHGSPNADSGMSDVVLLEEELRGLAARTSVEITICSNSQSKYDALIRPMPLATRYREWSIDDFPDVLGEADAVILPVTLNPFTACKSHNRLTLALYAGLPVVATGIESYREFEPYCTLDSWVDGLSALTHNYDRERRRAMTSRTHIDSAWSTEAVGEAWEKALDLPAKPKAAETPRKRRAGSPPAHLQGNVDVVTGSVLTGWVRDLQAPRRRLDVVLECNGEIAATTRASLPRPDLRLGGMSDSSCGFSLPLPEWCISGPRAIRVLAEGWLIDDQPLIAKDVRSVSPVEPLTASKPELAPPAVEAVATRLVVEPSIDAQQALLLDVTRAEALLSDIRRAAARAVVAFAESPELAARAQAALSPTAPCSDN